MNYDSLFIVKIMTVDDKKEAILNAASVVFSTEGFHNTKLSKVSEIAGIGTGTVYLYFKNKEAILEELFIRSWSRIENKLNNMKSIRNMTPKQKIAEILAEIVELAASNNTLAKIILHEYRYWSSGKSDKVSLIVQNINNLLIEIINNGKESGDFNSTINAVETAVFIIGGVWFYLSFISENISSAGLDKLTNQLSLIIFNGIC